MECRGVFTGAYRAPPSRRQAPAGARLHGPPQGGALGLPSRPHPRPHGAKREVIEGLEGSKLLHIGIGRCYEGTPVMLLIHERDVRVLTEDGNSSGPSSLDPRRNYQTAGLKKVERCPARGANSFPRHHNAERGI